MFTYYYSALEEDCCALNFYLVTLKLSPTLNSIPIDLALILLF